MPFCTIDEALADLSAGKMIVLTDDENRENEGDLVLAAQFTTPQVVNFMLSTARGYLCLSLTESDCDRLSLGPQSSVNSSVRGTPFTVSIDGHPRHGFTTGVSARERADTILMAIRPDSRPDDFVRPGHINPLRSRDGGVLVRTGQTEGAVDLCRLAGLQPAAVIIEIMREDGEMARVPDLEVFCKQHGVRMCSVAQIIERRLQRESVVRRLDPTDGIPMRTAFGEFRMYAFESVVDDLPHVVLTMGDVGGLNADGTPRAIDEAVLVRMHRRQLLGDVFHDLDSPAGEPSGALLHESMRMIAREGRGAIVYLRSQEPGDGLAAKLLTPRRAATPRLVSGHLPDSTSPESERATRDVGVGLQVLRQLGITRARLLTNSRKQLPALDAFGVSVEEVVPIRVGQGGGQASAIG